MRITVWNEFRHEKTEQRVADVYPNGIHNCIADFLRAAGHEVRTATLDEPEHGLTQEVLDNTDVLFWWGHMAHKEVSDEIVDRVHQRVLEGMGIVVLHSGHASKIFHKLMGTRSLKLRWREIGEREIMWNVNPSHPITRGIGANFVLPHEETYGERFEIADPDDICFISWFEGGEVFRSGCTFTRGEGKIFYFQPGHETYPTYYIPEVQKVLLNAAEWCYNPAPQNIPSGHFPVPFIDTLK